MAIFRENDDVLKASRDEMPIFLRFSKLRATYLFAKFCDLTHFPLGENWDQSTLAGIGLKSLNKNICSEDSFKVCGLKEKYNCC